MKTKLIIIFIIVMPIYIFGQKLNHSIELNIDSDHKAKHALFYDSYDGKYEKTEFTRFCIVTEQDSFCFENPEVWVEQKELYSKADNSIENRLGIINENGKIYIWLTGYQYGCCLNNTTILEWTGQSLHSLFCDDFKVIDIKVINNKKYVIGNYSLTEVYGDIESDYYFYSFYPTEYRLLSDSMKVDKFLTQKENNQMKIIEDSIDVYSVSIVQISYTGERIMISHKLEKSVTDREYGIISLTKLDRNYFKNFTKQELKIFRNEIFAYYGYSFNSNDLKDYFSTKNWYNPTDISSESITKKLTEIESYNINLIKDIEKNGP